MRTSLHTLLICLTVLASTACADDDAALAKQACAALDKATAYMRSIACEGGYLWKYSADLKQRAGENQATATQIWIQPPGTPSVGEAFLRAYEATKDARYLDAARAAAMSLVQGQLESGGWDYLLDFDPAQSCKWYRRSDVGKLSPKEIASRKNMTTFDDNNTQSAILFLLAVVDAAKGTSDPRDQKIKGTLDYALKKMIEAQYPNGAWPQRWNGQPHKPEDHLVVKARYPQSYPREYPRQTYYGHYTLNDDAQRDCVMTMIDAWHRTNNAAYLDAAKKGGDFLILAQMPEPQPVWAQQYNAQMEPAWARAFEPPAITGCESTGAMMTLMDLYIETGDEKFLKPLPPAVAWYKRSSIAPNTWARYYELQTNKQLFGDRDGKIHSRIEEISEERQHGYSWSGEYHVGRTLAFYEKLKSEGREAMLKARQNRPQKKTKASAVKSLAARAKTVIAALDDQGRWLTKPESKKKKLDFGECVETHEFIKNVRTLCAFLESAGVGSAR